MKPLQGAPAEKAVEDLLKAQGWATHRAVAQVVRKGPFVFSPSNDTWGCIDISAMHPEQGFWHLQITGGGYSAMTARRRKVEAMPWPLHMIRIAGGFLRVSVLQVGARQDPSRRARRRQDFAEIHDLTWDRRWEQTGELVLPRAEPKPSKPRAKKPQPQTALAYVPGPEDPPI